MANLILNLASSSSSSSSSQSSFVNFIEAGRCGCQQGADDASTKSCHNSLFSYFRIIFLSRICTPAVRSWCNMRIHWSLIPRIASKSLQKFMVWKIFRIDFEALSLLYGPGFGHFYLPLLWSIFFYDNAFPHRPLQAMLFFPKANPWTSMGQNTQYQNALS